VKHNFYYKNTNIKEYHIDVKKIIEKYNTEQNAKVIEIGCGTGITSLLLNKNFEKTLLDINPEALKLAKLVFEQSGQKADFVLSDMFHMDMKDESFDIVFNSGVIEHFDLNKRVEAIKEYKRILKKNGLMIIAFPNHYNIFYRLAYLLFNFLGRWSYPKEYKLYDLREEIEKNNLTLITRIVTSKTMVLGGYLTVLVIKKVAG
jgi:ubiquinone/menaquinone biosynthesis C-methylase UbiE